MHGGTISVKSKFGEGSEFIIKLPVTLVDEDNAVNSESYYESLDSKYVERVKIEFSDIYE